MAEKEEINKHTVIEDEEGNRLVFTGRDFREVVFWGDYYRGMRLDDNWKIIGNCRDLYPDMPIDA